MDLQLYAIILIVFLVSFMSYLFISQFLPHGKTFDEMIAEKKRMREEVLGTLSKAPLGKHSNSSNKKKPKKEVKKKETQVKVVKEVTSNDSDETSESSETNRSEPPATPPEQIVLRKNVTKQQQGKKGKSKGGILINKNEPVLVKEDESVEEANHFEEIHPKDALEIQRATVKEDEKNARNFREGKKAKPTKETPPVSPKNQSNNKETKAVEEKIVKKKRSDQAVANVAVATERNATQFQVTDETGITPLIHELSRADLTKNQIQVLIDFLLNKQSDTIARDPTEWTEGKSDLVQKLKKQLQEKEAQLKNEQDTLYGTQTKLKELRNEFNAEKIQFNSAAKAHNEQMQALKSEIKTLKNEINFLTEKHNSEKQSMSASFKQLQTKYLQVSESLKLQENVPTIQQVQSENQLLQQDIVNKNQQIIELNVLIDEARSKNETLNQKLTENDKKIAEFEVCLRNREESAMLIENDLRQRVQDLAIRDNDIQKLNGLTNELNAEISRIKELLQRQSIENDQLKKANEQHQNNHAEENNKIEIRNLQNALDSSKKELEAHKVLLSDFKLKVDELNKQLVESKQLTQKPANDSFLLNEKINEMVANHQNVLSEKDRQLSEYQKQIANLQRVESDLCRQIEEQRAKNNDLRTKNWKLVEALQAAQQSLSTNTSNHSNFNHSSVNEDMKKVKDLLIQYFPEAASSSSDSDDETKWLQSVLENLKMQLVSNKSNHTTPSNDNHLNNCNDIELNNCNKTVNGDSPNSASSSSSSKADNELVLLQNAQLKTTVEEYKNIIAETESMLKNLESKVKEQDAYWAKVVLMKDNEIETLRNVSNAS